MDTDYIENRLWATFFQTLGNTDFQWMCYGTAILARSFGDRMAPVAGSGSESDDVPSGKQT